jgi:hypothetical protein
MIFDALRSSRGDVDARSFNIPILQKTEYFFGNDCGTLYWWRKGADNQRAMRIRRSHDRPACGVIIFVELILNGQRW